MRTWVDADALAEALAAYDLPGVYARPVVFEPTFQKHAKRACGGCQLHVLDREHLKVVDTAVAVLTEIRAQNPSKFEWRQPPYEYEHEKLPFDILAGSSELRNQIESGLPVEAIHGSWIRELERFDKTRQRICCIDPEAPMDRQRRATLIAKYKDGYRIVAAALDGADEAELDSKPAPGKWSAREIVHHLADSEMTSAIRLRLLLAEERAAIRPYDEKQFAQKLHYDRPIASSLHAFKRPVPRQASCSTASAKRIMGEGRHSPGARQYGVERWLRSTPTTLTNHADQIQTCTRLRTMNPSFTSSITITASPSRVMWAFFDRLRWRRGGRHLAQSPCRASWAGTPSNGNRRSFTMKSRQARRDIPRYGHGVQNATREFFVADAFWLPHRRQSIGPWRSK